MSSWWQNKLLRYCLRYGLSRTGFLDAELLDLDNFVIAFGRKNVIELKDIALNVEQVSKAARLPQCLRLETAHAALFRLTVPADVHRSHIVLELDGIELVCRLEDDPNTSPPPPRRAGSRSPTHARTPQHRKTNRRLPSTPPHGSERPPDFDDDLHIPTIQEVTKSFLRDEPLSERRAMEASIAVDTQVDGLDDSLVSEGSDTDELGTGMGIGLPGFFSNFLRGIIDRFTVAVKNIEVRVEAEIGGDMQHRFPVTLRLRIGTAGLDAFDPTPEETAPDRPPQRFARVRDISLDLLTDAPIFDEASETQSTSIKPEEMAESKEIAMSEASSPLLRSSAIPEQDTGETDATVDTIDTVESTTSHYQPELQTLDSSETLESSASRSYLLNDDMMMPPTTQYLVESHISRNDTEAVADESDLDIQPGDDNISWGSRRSQSNAPAEDLWSSMASDDDLPDSLLIESERAATPRLPSSREESPSAIRPRRRPGSPYERAFRGPGSWPTLEDAPAQPRPRSPQSWPRLNQSQHSAYEPLARVLETAHQQTDNKKVALELTESIEPSLPDASRFAASERVDMSESRYFSHEEAQSMYMSAMTSGPDAEVPGPWTTGSIHDPTQSQLTESRSEPSDRESADARDTDDLGESSHDRLQPALTLDQSIHDPIQSVSVEDPVQSTGDLVHSTHDVVEPPHDPQSGNVTPRAHSPKLEPVETTQPAPPERVAKQLLSVDALSVAFPRIGMSVPEESDPVPSAPAPSHKASYHSHSMPGTFSAYSDMSSSRRGLAPSVHESHPSRQPSSSSRGSPAASTTDFPVACEIEHVRVLLDVSAIKLLYKASRRVISGMENSKVQHKPAKPAKVKDSSSRAPFLLSLKRVSLSLCHEIEISGRRGGSRRLGSNEVLGLSCEHLSFDSSEMTDLKIGALGVAICGSELLSIHGDSESSMGSRLLTKDNSAIAVQLQSYETSPAGRPVTEIAVETSLVKLKMDTTTFEQVIEDCGGIDNIIELSNSFAPDGAEYSGSHGTKSSKGVRFAGDSQEPPPGPEYKVNARLGGVIATLYGSHCSVVLRTTTLKAVYRELGAVATVEHISLTGPYDDVNNYEPPASVDLTSLRVEYLVTPHDKDLERLLSLLTPSKDKYENDDDILIDTLLRQRRKGGLLRLSIGLLKFKLDDWACTSALSMLSAELTKLSAVAKYLPEDERPGLLTLCRVREFESQLPVNDTFGNVRITAQDFHLAHVGLPALLAFSIGSVGARRADDTHLLHDLLPSSGAENLPMIMARMLGDEADPSVKIKLYNLCVEYNPSLIADFVDGNPDVDVEEVAASLVQTVANLAVTDMGLKAAAEPTSQKRVTIDLLVHESAIGLTPHQLTSKALFVLTDAQFIAKVPPEKVLTIQSDFRQASIMLTDNLADHDDHHEPTLTGKGQIRYASGSTRLPDALSQRGFVSVVSIMAAHITVCVREEDGDVPQSVEVDVRNELLLLETCADSTQTLIATLGALAPPTPPSTEPKYLTEPMTIEDMMASFTGDAIEERPNSPETLFDADADAGLIDDLELPLEYSTMIEDADGLLAESEMTSSLYGPISGVFGPEDNVDTAGSVTDPGDFPETAESLLEEDPFEMTITPEDMPLSDTALMRSLAKQSKPAASEQPVEVDFYEIDDLGFDALPSNQGVLGDPHRFNAPHAGSRSDQTSTAHPTLPFQLKLRDFHVIWNLYDGYDWSWTRDGIADAVERVEQRAEARRARQQQALNDREDDESVIGDFLFNSIYIGVPAGTDAQDLRRQINQNIDDQISVTESVPASAMTRPTSRSTSHPVPRPRQRRRLKLGRSRSHKIAFELKGVSADVLTFPPGHGDVISTVDLRLRDFEIFDNIPNSTWRKFLTHLNNDPAAREMSKPMFHIAINTVKTLESHSASELALKVSVLPLRLHVDQDALDFITRFFEFKDQRTVNPNAGGEQPFLQRVEVDTVDLCLDYKPKNVDYVGLRSGRTKEFINFVTLDGANIRLRHAIVYGLRGFDTLHDTLNDVWMPDVMRNQLPTVLAGLAPVRSLVNIGSGVRDVVAIPIREYRKDGRIVRSIQKGAYQFGKTTASELARLGAKVALGTQTVLTTAEEYLSPARPLSTRPGSSRGMSSETGWHDFASDDEEPQRRAVSAYANQPLGVLSGLRSARRHLEHDLLTAKDALIAVQGEVLESRGPGAAAAAVARHAPTVILRPVIGATRAVGTTLLGVGNQIDRSNLRKVEDKYKRR